MCPRDRRSGVDAFEPTSLRRMPTRGKSGTNQRRRFSVSLLVWDQPPLGTSVASVYVREPFVGHESRPCGTEVRTTRHRGECYHCNGLRPGPRRIVTGLSGFGSSMAIPESFPLLTSVFSRGYVSVDSSLSRNPTIHLVWFSAGCTFLHWFSLFWVSVWKDSHHRMS